ncbi:MAG: TRAP transporter substrate-binding protein DctP [Bernardetiaceae bacterium]|nr:TRAP transporter substrate-binding protein DctP [Bernardetiaceae bacterium]
MKGRREFIKKVGLTSLAGGLGFVSLSACEEKKSNEEKLSEFAALQGSKPLYEWSIATTWPPNFPVLGEGVVLFAKYVKEMTGGKFRIKVFGGGERVPALEVFDAVGNGAIEMGHAAPYYWAGKVPSCQFFASIPFGMNAQQSIAWIANGGGLELWEEIYAPFGVVPMLGGNTGVQMGGWFNKSIDKIEDIKGLKMRMPGLGGKVLQKAGGSAVTVAGGEIYTNLERGVIDATEWIGPYHDYKMGFHKVARYYYYPGWHEPGSLLEFTVNKSKYESLPNELQEIIRAAAARASTWMFNEFEVKNMIYLDKIMSESSVELREFPQSVLEGLKVHTNTVFDELTAQDAPSRKIYEAYKAFRNNAKRWSAITEEAFYQKIQI